jgi:hypothetical protein
MFGHSSTDTKEEVPHRMGHDRAKATIRKAKGKERQAQAVKVSMTRSQWVSCCPL